MENTKQKMAIVGSRGLDDERATVMMTMARGAQASGLDVTLFLVASGVDLVRRGAADNVQMNPFDPPMKELVGKFMEDGGDAVLLIEGAPCPGHRAVRRARHRPLRCSAG